MKTELTITRWNVTALIGWFSLLSGLLGVLLQLWTGVQPSVWLSVLGVVGGGIILSLCGPLKTVTSKVVELKPADISDETD